MAITEAFTGTETVTNAEHSLTTDTGGPDAETSDGAFQVFVELNNLANGDTFKLTCWEKVNSGSTQRVVEEWFFSHVQSRPIAVTPVLILLHGWDFTLIRVAGSDRSISWSIRKVA